MIVIYKASLIHSTIEIIAFFLFFFGKSKTSNGFEKSIKDHSNKIKDQQVLNNLKKNSIKPNLCYEKNELSKSIEMFDFNYSKKLIDFIWNITECFCFIS